MLHSGAGSVVLADVWGFTGGGELGNEGPGVAGGAEPKPK